MVNSVCTCVFLCFIEFCSLVVINRTVGGGGGWKCVYVLSWFFFSWMPVDKFLRHHSSKESTLLTTYYGERVAGSFDV